ncbi:MAG: D-alanyl-D-alanine carboxypeptidase [Clostridia bacterium]|nr:D-alanyl-D-alanine carboxypeptidase [Clostridia bacterium]
MSIPVDRLTPDQSGAVVVPAGDASLPVAFTGVNARAAVLLEAGSGEVIFGQNENARLPMASTTKIMTALVALEALPLDTSVKITAESVGVEGSSVYLAEGEVLTLEQLLYALLLESANDAASAIAVAVSGSVEAFAERMNRKATELGLTDTHFVNPHGLDAEGHYTTAYELAVIARAALENETFRTICATERKTIPLHGTEGVRLLLNHNKLLDSYEGCIGVKTGFTKKTGRCLVSAAKRDGVTLIAVTLGAPDDWRDHTAMLDYGFGLYETVPLCGAGSFSAPLWLVSGSQEYVMVENADALAVTLRRDHGPIRCAVELPRFEFAPVQAGQAMGQLRFFEEARDGTKRELGAVPLKASYGVEAVTYPQSLWERLLALFSKKN